MSRKDVLNLSKDYVVFDPEGQHRRWPQDEFWAAAFSGNHPAIHPKMGSLISRYTFSEDWTSWERHPNGDELIYVISGRLNFVLEREVDSELELATGDAFVIPRGIWHTAKVLETAEVLFVTYGYGTEHRAL
jgi:mannose-6-phosphate isomerase-like protein (cupin superfamily)